LNSKVIIIIIFLSFCLAQDKGLNLYQNQEYEAAINYYESVIINKEDNLQAHFGRGASSFQQGNLEMAKKGFEKSLTSSDEILRSKSFYNLGNTFYKNNKREEAMSFYRKALEINPNDNHAKFNYELLKYQKQPPEEDKKDQDDQEKKEEEKKEEEKKEEEKKEEEKKEEEKKEEEQKAEEQKAEESKDKKDQDLKQAESILDALKQDEKIMQKKQISRAKSRKLVKDWE